MRAKFNKPSRKIFYASLAGIGGTLALTAAVSTLKAQDGEDPSMPPGPEQPVSAESPNPTFVPVKKPFSQALLDQLKLPDGYSISVFLRSRRG